ncbi:hypothetical protein N5T96_08605 [Aliarcobacter butzleri]|uniref:hypothetical protein n=1 Tax=Aliarcobacter butzleri TaxID=28197 RepID=UPI0021B4E91A|nr:hypothetical protein [Aliarcobacter butzleri]MCT7566400.1 hypothetical protein [Aliarcobacter butzleri]
MKTIFAKYNSERLPKYQIVTKIVVDDNGQKYAIKEALCDEAKEHIEDIYNNYELLKATHNLNLVKPIKTENGVMFEMAQGISLENVLLEAVAQNDKERFSKYIDKFLDLLDGMVTKRNTIFEPSEEFTTIFGQWELNEPQDIIKPANIDLIFGNIFVDENDEFTLIDYEWVFDIDVPKSYIAWRSLAIFSAYHYVDLSKYMDDSEDIEDQRFLKYDNIFSNFVHGKKKEYFLAPKVGKRVDFINFEKKETIINYDYFIQLFIENENPFSEKNSIKLPVSQTTELQNFEFDLKDFENIKNLRLDPLNDICVVNISQIYLVVEDDLQIDLKSNIQANACSHHVDSYFFEFFDPNIYFEDVDFESLSIKKFVVELIYNHIARDAVHSCTNQIAMDKNYIVENQNRQIQNQNQELETKEQSIKNLNDEIEIKEQQIQNQNQELETKEQSIKNLNDEIENQKQQIQNQKQELETKEQSIKNLNDEIENQKQQIQNQKQELETKEQSIKNLNDEIEIKEQQIQNQNQELETKEQSIKNLNDEIENQKQQIQNQKQELETKEQSIKNLNDEIENQKQQIQNQKQELETKEQSIKNLNDELINIYMSKSWKISLPLRSLIRKIKKGK